ncbi:coiled-coil domain-containing protein 63-like [Colias croceus]|uniref:coiled-coil domain-containing protein 63-like n=1 Tax=Colias crocea TaxID=72248 RepID=UPI001E280C32|nr:coiled-coil domain-containing protein 63-like [Colias croceus]
MSGPSDDMEMEKMAEDELSKLQRQFRVMEVDRANVMSSVKPTLRVQRNIIQSLTADLDKIMMQLKLTKSTSNVLENAKTREKLLSLLKDHEIHFSEVKEYRANINELDFLLKQVQKEIKKLRSKGSEKAYDTVNNETIVSQLENRLNTAMTKFNSVNSENYSMRLHIDRLLCDRQFFNTVWKGQVRRLVEGKALVLELVEGTISTYEQREEWCAKLEALKEKAAVDYRRHCLEVRELHRQLEYSAKLEQFLRSKGALRRPAGDRRAAAKRARDRDLRRAAYCGYCSILDGLKEYMQEDDVDKLILEFTRREEENYALFNYINEVNTELKNLSDNVKSLRANIEEEHTKHQAKLHKQQVSIDSLRNTLAEKQKTRQEMRDSCEKTRSVLDTLLQQVHSLASSSECESLPLLKLLGQNLNINVTNARLFIKSLEKKITEIVEVIKFEEKFLENSARAPAGKRSRGPRTPRPLHTAHTPRRAHPTQTRLTT